MIPKATFRSDYKPSATLPRRLGWVLACWLLTACDVTPPADDACKRLEILVGFGIGGGTDTFARQLASPLAATAGVPVQVVNLTAGSGIAAYRELLARPSDGWASNSR